jgi:hypothetical protein
MTRHPDHDRTAAFRLAEGLGWFSIGLGLTELLAARPLARALGMEEKTELFRAYGARELATGVGILTQRDPTPWIWGRVGGDVLDLATLATGLGDNPRAGNVGLAIAAVAGVTALDVICAQSLSGDQGQLDRPMRDYSDRIGMRLPADAMRGAARDFEPPRDFRIPEPLRPYASG